MRSQCSPASSSSTTSAVDSSAVDCTSRIPRGSQDVIDDQDGEPALTAVFESLDMLHSILLLTASENPQQVGVNLMGVCRQWKHLARNLPVWHTMEVRTGTSEIHASTTSLQWAHLARKSHRLPETPSILFNLIQSWWGSKLHSFAAQGCPVTCELLTDAFCVVLAQHAPNLQALRLASCYRITDVGLCALAHAAPPLRHLELTWCGPAVTANGILAIAAGCVLESLVVSCGHEGNGLLSVDDAVVAAVAQHCPLLHTLGLNDCAVGDAGLLAIAQSLGTRLRCLQLNHTTSWSAHGLVAALAQCPSLASLSVAGSPCLDDAALALLLAQCTGLQHVDMSRCRHVTLDGGSACCSLVC